MASRGRWRFVVPNLITATNLLCGAVSTMLSVCGLIYWAGWLIMVSVLLDKLDGTCARKLSASSRFGVEFDSLVRFFEANMPKDNWRAVGHIKADSAMMLFHKENRWCVITLEEGSYYTYAHIWVAPTVFTPDAALMPSSAN